MTTLMERLNYDPDVTEQDVLQYLQIRSAEGNAQNMIVMPVDEFWKPGDLEHFKALQAWWPKFAPTSYAPPFLGVYCYRIIGTELTRPISIMEHMTIEYTRCKLWLEANGHSVDNPNETKEERRRRKGREAVNRHRKTAQAMERNPAADEIRQLHRAYIAACQARKAAAAAHDESVRAALTAWEEAKIAAGIS